MSPLSGPETILKIRESQNKTILAFSRGKDAIAAWISIRDHFDDVIPYYLYLVPGLEFEEQSIDYFERFFCRKIIKLPNPAVHRMLNNLVFQPPEHCLVVEQAKLPIFGYEEIRKAVVNISGCDQDTYVADGVRAADSPMRRIAITKHGTISHNLKKYHPVWDLKKDDLVSLFRRHNIKLPIDYKIWGRSFDGLDLRFLLPLKKYLPGDYKKVLEYFQLADLEIFRWEKSHAH
jgi:3'-phosphoadenosine 5'-phosphosulfate sulfotransferase (PAPS reductase)/FAD synthetase